MDIGVPFRVFGPIDVSTAIAFVKTLPDDAWVRNTFRQDVHADKAHAATRAIIFKHEWQRWRNPWQIHSMEDLVRAWARETGIDPTPFLPKIERETDVGPVYVFPEWTEYEPVLGPIVEEAVNYVRTPNGFVTRIALVLMAPGHKIPPHVDCQIMAGRAHRLHVPLIAPPGVEYKIGGKKLRMKVGRVYDFNNRIRHSVRHNGKLPRINLFVDYYPNPSLYVRSPLEF